MDNVLYSIPSSALMGTVGINNYNYYKHKHNYQQQL